LKDHFFLVGFTRLYNQTLGPIESAPHCETGQPDGYRLWQKTTILLLCSCVEGRGIFEIHFLLQSVTVSFLFLNPSVCFCFFFGSSPDSNGCSAHAHRWAQHVLFCGVNLRGGKKRSTISLVSLPLLPTLVRAHLDDANRSCPMKLLLKISNSTFKVNQSWQIQVLRRKETQSAASTPLSAPWFPPRAHPTFSDTWKQISFENLCFAKETYFCTTTTAWLIFFGFYKKLKKRHQKEAILSMSLWRIWPVAILNRKLIIY